MGDRLGILTRLVVSQVLRITRNHMTWSRQSHSMLPAYCTQIVVSGYLALGLDLDLVEILTRGHVTSSRQPNPAKSLHATDVLYPSYSQVIPFH